jgi:hypothetical protein
MEKFIALTTIAAFLIFAGTYALAVRTATSRETEAPPLRASA